MTKKLKMYAVSVMAFKPNDDVLNLPFINDPDESEVVTLVHQLPALIPAYSMEEASEEARTFAFARWSESEGWYSHQAAITPVTNQFYEAAFLAYKAGVVDVSDETEEGQAFNF
jgi:hypothetical protein